MLGFEGVWLTRITSTDREDDLADIDAGDEAIRLAEGSAHAGLETIGSGARQHLVDADDVVRVGADAEMETFLSGNLDKIPLTLVLAMPALNPVMCIMCFS